MERTAMAGRDGLSSPQPPNILLAEDNDDLRDVMTVCLTMKGYGVIACPDGRAALAAFHAAESVDLLLTDIEMPWKSGVDLARDLRALRSSLPVVVVSGSVISRALEEEMRSNKWSFLSKPYALPQLLGEVERLLQLPGREPLRPAVQEASRNETAGQKVAAHAFSPLGIIATRGLREGGLKVDLSDGTCVFLTLAELTKMASRRQPQTAAWPVGLHPEYCCYDGCTLCS